MTDLSQAEVVAKLKKQDEERGYMRFEASGWEGTDYRDLEDLSPEELNEIDEINTDENVISRLKEIESKKKMPLVESFSSKALPKDNLVLQEKGVKLTRRRFTEEFDRDLEHQEEGDELIRGGNSSRKKSSCMVVRREARRINVKQGVIQQRITSRTSNISSPTTKRTPPVITPLTKKKRIVPQSVSSPGKPRSTSHQNNIYSCFDNDICVLATLPRDHSNSNQEYNDKISVARQLGEKLKPHQKEGIQFMWNKVCGDIMSDNTSVGQSSVQGCVLAHSMGLGYVSFYPIFSSSSLYKHQAILTRKNVASETYHRKSLQVISLVHTLLTHPRITLQGKRIINRVLLIVPVNILVNWQAEFDKWCVKDMPKFQLYNFSDIKETSARLCLAENWFKNGGVLFCSIGIFTKLSKKGSESDVLKQCFLKPGPDRKSIINLNYKILSPK